MVSCATRADRRGYLAPEGVGDIAGEGGEPSADLPTPATVKTRMSLPPWCAKSSMSLQSTRCLTRGRHDEQRAFPREPRTDGGRFLLRDPADSIEDRIRDRVAAAKTFKSGFAERCRLFSNLRQSIAAELNGRERSLRFKHMIPQPFFVRSRVAAARDRWINKI
jgi:hypothetical protein